MKAAHTKRYSTLRSRTRRLSTWQSWKRNNKTTTERRRCRTMDNKKTYIAIDLKSFYASVECVARGLDPLTTNLVVADVSRTEKTICLAVSPSLKSDFIPGRARLFEVIEKLREVNAARRLAAPGRRLTGEA